MNFPERWTEQQEYGSDSFDQCQSPVALSRCHIGIRSFWRARCIIGNGLTVEPDSFYDAEEVYLIGGRFNGIFPPHRGVIVAKIIDEIYPHDWGSESRIYAVKPPQADKIPTQFRGLVRIITSKTLQAVRAKVRSPPKNQRVGVLRTPKEFKEILDELERSGAISSVPIAIE